MPLGEIYNAVDAFIVRHEEILSVYAYFIVMALAPALPWPFSKIPPIEWFYELNRNALQSLFTSRHPDLEKTITVKSVEVQTTVGSTPEPPKQDVDSGKTTGLS